MLDGVHMNQPQIVERKDAAQQEQLFHDRVERLVNVCIGTEKKLIPKIASWWRKSMSTIVKIDYGVSCGRHWMKINDVMIAQSQGDDVWMRDADVCDLARAIIPDCNWEKAFRLDDGIVGVELLKDHPKKIENYGFAKLHDPRSKNMYDFFNTTDLANGDAFGLKSGGDGDNGEMLMDLLDVYWKQHDEDMDKCKT